MSYAYGKVDMEALRERAGAAAPVAEVLPQAEEEPASSEPASKTCTWPPLEAEYFFGENAIFGPSWWLIVSNFNSVHG